ncbi:MAG: OmpH family outer membrane protein [Chlorobi bacterium]|nr:OmpH family outer membrane protein [Chlorobiota bacterium]
MLLLFSGAAMGQKYAYVDTKYILDNIPEYQDAQDELDALSEKWQKEIEQGYAQVDEMYKKYKAEAVLLPEDIKRKREDEIVAKEKEMKDLQKKYFGPEGDLFQKREELVKPIQEKIYNAIETVATTRNFSFVFDKAGGMTLLWANPKFDISDDVLDEVGNVMQTVKREQRKKGGK